MRTIISNEGGAFHKHDVSWGDSLPVEDQGEALRRYAEEWRSLGQTAEELAKQPEKDRPCGHWVTPYFHAKWNGVVSWEMRAKCPRCDHEWPCKRGY